MAKPKPPSTEYHGDETIAPRDHAIQKCLLQESKILHPPQCPAYNARASVRLKACRNDEVFWTLLFIDT